MKPIPAVIENGMWRAASANTPPVNARGTPVKTTSASRTAPKARTRSKSTSASAIGTTIASLLRAVIRFSNWPPHPSQ